MLQFVNQITSSYKHVIDYTSAKLCTYALV